MEGGIGKLLVSKGPKSIQHFLLLLLVVVTACNEWVLWVLPGIYFYLHPCSFITTWEEERNCSEASGKFLVPKKMLWEDVLLPPGCWMSEKKLTPRGPKERKRKTWTTKSAWSHFYSWTCKIKQTTKQKQSFNKQKSQVWGYSSEVEHALSIYETLGSVPNIHPPILFVFKPLWVGVPITL